MSAMLGYILGLQTLVVGVEDDTEDGALTGDLRMYLSHRSRGLYAILQGEEEKEDLRRAWADATCHLTVEWPPDECLYSEKDRP